MEIKKCKNKKCMRTLHKSYKHKYCEKCRNEQVKMVKDAIKGLGAVAGGVLLTVFTKGNIKIKK